MPLVAMDNALTDDDLRKTYRGAIKVLYRAGWPVQDHELLSALNAGMLKAIPRWCPERGSFIRLVIRYGLREYAVAKAKMARLRRGDQAAVDRGTIAQPTPTPIPLTDFELLSFVAAHGRMISATLLGLTPARLRDLLDEVALRIKNGLSH